MEEQVIKINNKQYQVKIAKTEEQRKKGLQGVEKMNDNEGMLFVFDSPQTV